ncbi:GyrI-like domain-containing protein [Aneurinibacillus terranovensis]|uniref:GyrI-like domain-containing protein n=1 Tax=Aneurinibacillus terranovensis TaxID=278991 RepID=UPI000412566E|nr:GyrI-like domain-containing protein [Aneurinibacillus terranovensis]
MVKIDYKKELKNLYNSPKQKNIMVEVPEMNYVMIDGAGNPNTSPDYKDAVEALFSVSYAVKFLSKNRGTDYMVLPLEGLWYADDMNTFDPDDKNSWKWTMMIMQPNHITNGMVETAMEVAQKKKNPRALSKIRFESYVEGLSAQILYIGPYANEHPTIMKLHDFIRENGYSRKGHHHEIYLSDPRKTHPEKLKTILRQSVQ